MKQFTIGADPEFFLMDEGKHISAIGLVGGSKNEPRPLERAGFGILEDNVAVEFNIAPAHNHQEFIDNIQYVLATLKQQLPMFEFSQQSAVIFDKTELQHPQALEFGCEPDFNAWTKQQNPRPKATDAALRSAGGHIHVGVDGVDPYELIRAMDAFVGVPAIKLDKHGALRRDLYGKAGCCRIKPYGAEYRTLSNFWIFDNTLIKWAYEATQKAVDFVAKGNTIPEEHGSLIQAAINDNDGEAYEFICKAYGLA